MPDSPVNHSTHGFWCLSPARALLLTASCSRCTLEARRSAKSIMPAADSLIVVAIDQNECARVPVLLVGIERHRHRGGEIAETDLVETERARRQQLKMIDVELVLDHRDFCGRPGAADPHHVGSSGKQRVAPHPEQMRGELVGDIGPPLRLNKHIAARDVDVVRQNHCDGVPGVRLVEIAVSRDDPRDGALGAAAAATTASPRRKRPLAIVPAMPRKSRFRPVDPLHRKPQRLVGPVRLDVNGFQVRKQTSALCTRPGSGSAQACCRRTARKPG